MNQLSRSELFAIIGSLLLLAAVVLPAIAAADPAAKRKQCEANLAAVGKAFDGWAAKHAKKLPWSVPLRQGGTHALPGGGIAWVHFAWLSNHLQTPKFLACPADKNRRVATTFSINDPAGGFVHQNFRDNALSYFAGIDASTQTPRALLAGDANFSVSARTQKCDHAGVNNAASLNAGDDTIVWNSRQHGKAGNILFQDGSVSLLNSQQLQGALPRTKAVHKDNHILLPR